MGSVIEVGSSDQMRHAGRGTDDWQGWRNTRQRPQPTGADQDRTADGGNGAADIH